MEFIQHMQQRYTTKMYNNSIKIDSKTLDKLKEILILSPSSLNSQPWKFTFVSDAHIKEQLAEVSYFNKEKVQNCDTVVVFRAIRNIEKLETQLSEFLAPSAIEYYNTFVKPQPTETILVWIEKQVYLALGVFLSACASMNIDSTTMEGIDVQAYDSILGYDDYATLVAVTIGYRDKEDFNQLHSKPKLRKSAEHVIESI